MSASPDHMAFPGSPSARLRLSMSPSACTPARSPLAIACFFLCGLVLTIVVPFYVPVQPAVSESYIFGFNNRAAVLVFFAFMAAFGWWMRSRPPRITLSRGATLSRNGVALLFGVPTLLLVLLWWLTRQSGGIDESTYFLDRLQELAHGQAIYRDFEFPYGPLPLYLPLWVAQLSHLSLTDAFYAVWMLQWLLGLWFLWRVVEAVCGGSARKNTILLLLLLTWLPSMLTLGPNYTPLRFWAVPYAVVMLYRRLAGKKPLLSTAVVALLWIVALMFYSTEQSFSFSGATLLMFALFVRPRNRELWLSLLLLGAGTVGMVAYSEHAGFLQAMHAMGSGGYNFPLLPALQLVPLLAMPILGAWVFADGLRHPEEAGVTQYLVATTLIALPAALGRCDTGHLIVNTVGATVVGWSVLAQTQKLWRWAWPTYLVVVLLLPLPITMFNTRRIVTTALKTRYTPERLAAMPTTGLQGRFASMLRQHGSSPQMLARSGVLSELPMPNGEPLMAPFGMPVLVPTLGGPLHMTSGRYLGMEDVTLPRQVEEKIGELRDHPARWLFMPRDFQCREYVPSRRELVLSLLALYVPPVRHDVQMYEPLCTYIRQSYRAADTELPSALAQYELLRPRVQPASSAAPEPR